MDQHIFEQLDKLEASARADTRRHGDNYNGRTGHLAHNDSGASVDYSIHEDLASQRRGGTSGRQDGVPICRAPIPQIQNDYNSGRTREPRDGRDVERSADESVHQIPSSSSHFNQPLPSSPAFNAGQRWLPAYEFGAKNSRPAENSLRTESSRGSRFQPVSLEQLEHELRLQAAQPEVVDNRRCTYGERQSAVNPKNSTVSPPVVQGIDLVAIHELPDRFRSIFPFPLFNAVQSKCFCSVYKTGDNFVLSAPTGSGKTAVLELAICRLMDGFSSGSYKIVYQAPTKSLCSERQRDWQSKFGPLGLNCAELTGDTNYAQLQNVQHAAIIIATPEKWDSMTRKWKDHERLMRMVKLFLIDEVHLLKDDRGATLEAVVSRMKSVGSGVRFIALSATVPNSEDIAAWLGRSPMNPSMPAICERFGEEFRPVRLQKHVCGYQISANNFAFEKLLNAKLVEVITKWSKRKPIMVFCFTRSSCVETAKMLAKWWAANTLQDRLWNAPRQHITVADRDLRDTISSGVAFHHAGLQIHDRVAVERGYLAGELGVICCTSTLAVGINLPCHMVIIKGTVTFQAGAGGAGSCKEYSDLEIMQMLGRAGRPQFDDSAIAVIMTRAHRVKHYERMISGQEVLESRLHLNLFDHLNAEIGLGTITSASSAKQWLSGTFLYVRLKDNPEHYNFDGDVPGKDLDDRLERICTKGIAMLEKVNLVSSSPKLHCTEFGDVMARYYVQFDTMKIFLALPPQAKISEILSSISQAVEFKDIRFRGNEKMLYKDLNKNSSIKFPIPVNLEGTPHKVSLVIQSVLGAIELPTEDPKHRAEYNSAKHIIFQHVHRLIRCIIDCKIYLKDAVSTRNALMLARSFGAQVWDDSPLHMKQLDGIGLVAVRKLVAAGISSIEDIENAEAHRLETILSRNPPYGSQLVEKAKSFPKLRVSLNTVGPPSIKRGECATVKIKSEIGFLNQQVPEMFQRRPIYVCLLAETSDGKQVHFARISAKKLNKGQDVLFDVEITSPTQSVRAYVMCDEIAGSARHAVLQPQIPAYIFPPTKTSKELETCTKFNAPNISKRRASALALDNASGDEFADADIDDADLVLAETEDFVDIDDLDLSDSLADKPGQKRRKTSNQTRWNIEWQPHQFANGKWACNHTCKDKTSCKHLCCREGLDKKPKPPKQRESKKPRVEGRSDPRQTQLSLSAKKSSGLNIGQGPTNQKAIAANQTAFNACRK
ncbi:hypothetical protein M433DRAFT_491622 [Acidomyces richmondensis BFW]|nr:MAG: hypothetical protein FE78DRAFT_290286 [Acidomyces sp. 'richmondensis']KYG47525.1 hypothetical protein M433DRAFT_491622 [Acidomyces richmondensis BFW]